MAVFILKNRLKNAKNQQKMDFKRVFRLRKQKFLIKRAFFKNVIGHKRLFNCVSSSLFLLFFLMRPHPPRQQFLHHALLHLVRLEDNQRQVLEIYGCSSSIMFKNQTTPPSRAINPSPVAVRRAIASSTALETGMSVQQIERKLENRTQRRFPHVKLAG